MQMQKGGRQTETLRHKWQHVTHNVKQYFTCIQFSLLCLHLSLPPSIICGWPSHAVLIVLKYHERIFWLSDCISASHFSDWANTATCGTWPQEPHKPQGPEGAIPNRVNINIPKPWHQTILHWKQTWEMSKICNYLLPFHSCACFLVKFAEILLTQLFFLWSRLRVTTLPPRSHLLNFLPVTFPLCPAPCTSPPSCALPGTFAPRPGLIHLATPLRPGELKALFVCTPWEILTPRLHTPTKQRKHLLTAKALTNSAFQMNPAQYDAEGGEHPRQKRPKH